MALADEDQGGSINGTAEKARTRNILAHQYLDIKWALIKDFLTTGWADIERFKAMVEKKLIDRVREREGNRD